MAQIITCKSISKAYSSDYLFEGLTLSFEDKCRCGIIGPNGTGKSTLLKIIAKLEEPDEGEVARKKGSQICYVAQSRNFKKGETISQILTNSAMKAGQDPATSETNTAIICSQLGFDSPEAEADLLSGGWQKRLAVAEQLIKEPELLLLDEPTNHLDSAGLMMLEELLLNAGFPWILITHDRYILDKIATEIVEMNPCYAEGYLRTQGGYSSHVKHREDLLLAYESHEKSLATKVRRENEWLQRGPKARTTKAKFRMEKAYQLQRELASLRALKITKSMSIDFTASAKKTKSLIAIKEGSIGYDSTLYDNINIQISRGDRLGILGHNGSGKSTLIKSLTGSLALREGERQEADQLTVVHFTQTRDELNGDQTLRQALGEGQDQVIFRDKPVHVISWAKRFGFEPEDLSTRVKDLSGGQLAKLHISKLMLKESSVLFLDEPTNDLDLETIEIVETSLRSFPGAIVIVSHDRRFLENLCTQFISLEPNGTHRLVSSFQQWEKLQTKPIETKKTKHQKSLNVPLKPKKNKLSYKHKFELENIESVILSAEKDLEEAVKKAEELAKGSDHNALLVASEELKASKEKVDQLYQRWEELEALENETN